jgi:hypothetical protein
MPRLRLAKPLAVQSPHTLTHPAGSLSSLAVKASTEEAPFWPSARMGSMLCCQGNMLFLYGGIVEVQDKQITLGDLYSIDLSKMIE